MKVLLIIIITIAVIVFAMVKFRQKQAKVTLNPVDSILPNGTMGFIIGDSKAFTLSRINHLVMATKEDMEEYNSPWNYDGRITVSRGMYNHISDVTFQFRNEKLSEITIQFDKQPDEIAEFWGIVMSRIANILGEPTFKHDGIAKWGNEISLFYDVTTPKEKWVLFLFIADNV